MPVAPLDRDVPHKRPPSRSKRHRKPYRPPASFRTEAASGQGYTRQPATPPQRPATNRGGRYTLPHQSTPRGDAGRRTTASQRAAIDRGVRDARIRAVRNARRPVITPSQLLNAVTFGAGGRGEGRRLPGAQAQPLADLPVISIPQRQAQNPEVTARKMAPVIEVLEQLNRPIHAVAAATRAEIADVKKHGYNPLDVKPNTENLKAAGRGFTLKDRSLFSDVLGDLGVDNPVAKAVGGLALDVGLDPLTYLTLGGSAPATVARRAATRKATAKATGTAAADEAAKKAYHQAVKRGATPKQARQVARQARKTHARRAGKRAGDEAAQGKATNRGLDVRFGGRSVPGLTSATAAVKRAPRAAADRGGFSGGRVDRAQQAVRDAVRSSVSEVNPNITPVGVDRDAYQAMRRAARTARARTQRGDVYAALHAQSFVNRVGGENAQKVLYAIEEGTTTQLPKGLRAEAARFTSDMRRMLKAERRAGVDVGDRTQVGDVVNYVKQLRVDGNDARGAARGRNVNPNYAKPRTEGTLREKNTAEPGAYSEDIGQVYAARASESSRSIAAARLNQALAKAGQPVSGSRPRQLAANESYYRVDGADLTPLNPKSQEAKILQNGWDTERKKIAARMKAQGKTPEQVREALAAIKRKVQGQHVVLNDKALERTGGTVFPAGERTTPGVFFDKAQGVWKIGATVINPGYYVRNYAGEAWNALLKENPVRLARNVGVSSRALREVRKREEAARKGERYVPGKHGELINRAEDVGAIRAGQYAREVGQLLARESGKKPPRLKGAGLLRRAARFRDNIEDQFRLASFKGGLDRGLPAERAMERSAKTHFDYGELTKTERIVLRRVMPFYTWSSRNIPLQIKMLVQQPGKFAAYEKLRQELAKAFGYEQGWEQRLDEYEQRGAPLPVKWKGKEFTLSLGPSGLPITDLNEFPTGPGALDEWLNRAASMVTPALKSPVEMWANFSFFFRDQLERDTSPLVPAPAWAQHLPDAVKKMTGLVPDYYNRKTGKYGWGWRAKADYIVQQVPGPAAFASRLSKDSTRQGQSDLLDTIAYLGPRIRPIDSAGVTLNNLYDERDEILKQQAAMRQRNIKTGRVPKPEQTRFLKLKKRARVVDGLIKQLSLEIEKMPESAKPEGVSLQDEILKRMTAPAQGPSRSALEEEIRRRLGG